MGRQTCVPCKLSPGRFEPDVAMKFRLKRRLGWLLWLLVVALFTGNALLPVSVGLTRAVGVALFVAAWAGLLTLAWRRRAVRWTLLAVTALALVFLTLPVYRPPDTAALRQADITALRRYMGTPYVWGGESPKGIDCSGLIRRGLIDASFLQGIRTANPGLVRYSLSLWWHDCSAKALGEHYRGSTRHLLDTRSINGLDQSQLRPGDFAVTQDGVHTLAFLGGNEWIEAEPDANKVITVRVPSDNGWFRTPVQVVRWDVLGP